MNLPPKVKKYLSKSPEIKKWKLSTNIYDNISKIVVIPALAESNSLLKTLSSLAENGPDELSSTLVICVVNNRGPAVSSRKEIEDNQITLDYLKQLSSDIHSSPSSLGQDVELFTKVKESKVQIAFVDASTPGRELPEKGGVGLARKIGMDLSLKILDYDGEGPALIICLDADTLVEENYLAEIEHYFNSHDEGAAVVAFSHILPEDEEIRAAALSYELFLRYYELGLHYANSPYAYQTIGSTIVCRAKAYAAVGGMNRKRAGEDFYFLQNLAKYGPVGHIDGTTVYPSMRVSDRVPFGTGRKMGELAESADKSIPFYKPEIFRILKEFIFFLNSADLPGMNGSDALEACREINGALANYLDSKNFNDAWDKIRKNSKDNAQFRKNLHVWFDAFQTFKLAHHLRDNGYGSVAMLPAVSTLLSMAGLGDEALPIDKTQGLEAAEKLFAIMRGKTIGHINLPKNLT